MSGKAIVRSKIIALYIISFLFINTIALMKSAMELEDAEQAYYSQWLRWGYDDQPPLYTWIQYLINQAIGVSKISFSLLRSVIFSGILIALYQFSKSILKNRTKSELTVFCLVLIPVFIDLTFRRLSHTALLTLLVILSYQTIYRLLQQRNFWNYLVLGFLIGVGILSKYNYFLFLGAVFMTVFVDKQLREVFLNKYILISILVCAILVTPHFYWLLGSKSYFLELQESVGVKMENNGGQDFYILTPFLSFLGAFLKLIALLIVVSILMLFKKNKFKMQPLDWFSKMFFAQLVLLVFFFALFNSAKIEVRWLLPLFLPFLVLLVKSMKLKRTETTSKYMFYLFLGVLFLQLVRTPAEKLLNISSSVHFGFEGLGDKLHTDYSDKQWILPNVTYGGNIRLLHPEKVIVTADDFSLPKSIVRSTDAVEVVLEKEKPLNIAPTDSLSNFGREGITVYFMPN